MNINKVRFLIELLDKIDAIHGDTFSSIFLDNESDSVNSYISALRREVTKMLNEGILK